MWCPASGTDHQFSHYWDMEGLCHNGKHVSHGFKVSIGTLVSTACLEYLVSKDFTSMDIDKAVAQWPEWEEMEKTIHEVFDGKPGHLARGLVESKGKYTGRDGIRKQLEAVKNNWPELREKIRRQIIPFMRNRFTGIDLIYRAGLMEEVENYLFGKPWK